MDGFPASFLPDGSKAHIFGRNFKSFLSDTVDRPMKTIAIITAAGTGARMGGDTAKQFLLVGDRPILAWTLDSFQKCSRVDDIILVVPKNSVTRCRKEIVDQFRLDKVRQVVAGGKRRQDSVREGLEAASEQNGLVMIHDGVRPIIDTNFLDRFVEAGKTYRAVISALPVKETIKEADPAGMVIKTLDRQRLWAVQTPQIFHFQDIFEAHQRALQEHWQEATDDAMLIERMGIPIRVMEGSESNIKITTPYDLKIARFMLYPE